MAFLILDTTYPNTIGPSSLKTNLASVVYYNLMVLMAFKSSAGVLGKAAVYVAGNPKLFNNYPNCVPVDFVE